VTAILSDTDEHYRYIAVGAITQNAANDYAEVLLESGEAGTASSTAVITTELKGDFAPNAFGKDKHGVAVWDVKQWHSVWDNLSGLLEAAQTNDVSWGIHSGPAVRTTVIPIENQDAGPVPEKKWSAQDIQAAAGEVYRTIKLDDQYLEPVDNIGGTSFGRLLTRERYSLFVDATGNSAAHKISVGMDARRVIVPLTEVFFDRDTIAGLLDAVVLDAILG